MQALKRHEKSFHVAPSKDHICDICSQGWKFMSFSHCQELGQQATWLLIGYTRVNNQSEARSASWFNSWPWLQLINFHPQLEVGGSYILYMYSNQSHLYTLTKPNSVHIFWLMPQYVMLTIGKEIYEKRQNNFLVIIQEFTFNYETNYNWWFQWISLEI